MTTSYRTAPNPNRIAIWVFVSALLFQAMVLMRFSQSPHFLPASDDMKFYSDWGVRIAGGQLTDGKAFYGLPGYAYFLAFVYKVAGFDPFIVAALQTVAFAGVAAVIFLLCVKMHGTGRSEETPAQALWQPVIVGLLAAAGWICFVPAQTFSVILMPTVGVVLAYWAAVLWLMRREPSSTIVPWLLLGAAVGLVATVVATILFVLPMALFAIIKESFTRQRNRFRQTIIAALALFAGVLAGTSPAWIHNYFVAKEPVLLSAHSGLNVWIGNNPLANGYPKIPPGLRASQEGLLKDSVSLAQAATGKPLKRFEVSKYWSEKANAWIKENRIAWLRLLAAKFENFWNAYQYDDLSTIKLLESSGVLLPGIYFGLASALGIPGMFLLVFKLPRGRWVVAAVILHMLAMLSVFVTERYRLAAVPGLLICAAFGIVSFTNWLKSARWGPAFAFATVTMASAAYVTLPRQDPGFWSLDHYKAGIRALDLGEMSRAKQELETAYAFVPTNSETNFALGNYWFTAGDLPRAKAFYRAALVLDEKNASAFNNLGVIMIQERRWDWATKLLQRAALIEPDDAKTYYLLAQALQAAGKADQALLAARKACDIEPTRPEYMALYEKLRSGPIRK